MIEAPLLVFKGLKSILSEYFKNILVYNVTDEKKTLELLSNKNVDVVFMMQDISQDYVNLISSKINSNFLNTKMICLVKNDQKIQEYKAIYFDKIDAYIKSNTSEEHFIEIFSDVIKKTIPFESIKDIKVEAYEIISNPITKLSKREYEIAIYMKNGMGNLEISNHLNIGASTVSTYKNRIFEKLQIKNIVELVDIVRKFENYGN